MLFRSNTGDHALKVRFEGDSLLAPANDKMTLSIVKANTKLSAGGVSLAYGERKPLSATLLRVTDKGNPAKTPLTFSLDDVVLGTAKTDANGVASLNYKLEETLAPGKHTLKVSFAGDANHNASSTTVTLTANKATTRLNQTSTTGKKGDTISLAANLKRNTGGANLSGRVVTFFVDGTSVGTATTGSDGNAALSYAITQAKGKYKLKVTFDGDDFYLPTTFEKALLTVK